MESKAFIVDGHLCIRLRASENLCRPPVHFCILLDNSGSMSINNKMSNVKQSLNFILGMLNNTDEISLITFSDITEKVIQKARVDSTEHKEAIGQRLMRVYADGGTNMSAGILNVRTCLHRENTGLRPMNIENDHWSKQGILLLTDGYANQGVTDEEGILKIVHSIIEEFPGVSISCVGYGMDHNAELLRKIAALGGGSYNIVENRDDVGTVFGDVLGGLSSCVFQQVVVELPIGWKQITKYAGGTEENREITVGDIQSGNDVVIVAKRQGDEEEEGQGQGQGQGQVHIRGFNIPATADVNTIVNIEPENSVSSTDVRDGQIAIARCKVVEIINSSRTNQTVYTETIAAVKNEILTLLESGESVVLRLLLEELQFIKSIQQLPRNNIIEMDAMLTQHEAYIGMTRGIWQTPTRRNDEDPTMPILSPYASCFSNYTQRHTSEMIRTMPPPPPPATRFGRQTASPHQSTNNLTELVVPISPTYMQHSDSE